MLLWKLEVEQRTFIFLGDYAGDIRERKHLCDRSVYVHDDDTIVMPPRMQSRARNDSVANTKVHCISPISQRQRRKCFIRRSTAAVIKKAPESRFRQLCKSNRGIFIQEWSPLAYSQKKPPYNHLVQKEDQKLWHLPSSATCIAISVVLPFNSKEAFCPSICLVVMDILPIS